MPLCLYFFLPKQSLLNACETPKKATLHTYTRCLVSNCQWCAHACECASTNTHAYTQIKLICMCSSMCNMPLAPLIKCQCEFCCCRDHRCTHGDIAFSLTQSLSLSLTERRVYFELKNKNKKRVSSKFASHKHTHPHTWKVKLRYINIRRGGEQ